MFLTRVATWPKPPKPAIVIGIGTTTIQVSQAMLATLDTEAEIESALETLASGAGITLPAIFVHINDDGSVALATGAAPDIWPEDR